MEDKTPVAEAGAQKTGTKACRSGRCRLIAVVVLAAAGGLAAAWWLAGERGGETPPVPERASSMLPGAMPPAPPATPPAGAAAPQLPGLDVMADKLAKRLEKEPADGEGWALLARTYLELGAVAKADAAYAKALALRPNDATMKADYEAARKASQAASP